MQSLRFCWLFFKFCHFCIRQHDVNILRSEFLAVWEMIVCSVFFCFCFVILQKWKQQSIRSSPFSKTSCNFLFDCCFVVFLHKTTWREYFDALSLLSCERCLCAPFSFFLFFLFFFLCFFFVFTKHHITFFLNFGPFSIFAHFW